MEDNRKGRPIVPSTPPRATRNQTLHSFKTPSAIKTPFTPKVKGVGLITPVTESKHKGNASQVDNHRNEPSNLLTVPVTPDFTPHRSPSKHHKRKRNTFEEISKSEAQEEFSAPTTTTAQHHASNNLLLPNPSTVGSGRKIGSSQPRLLKPPVFNLTTLAKLNDNLNFEEDADDSNTFEATPQKLDTSFIRSENLRASKVFLAKGCELPTRNKSGVPLTPRGQVISDEKVRRWHGKSFNDQFDSSDDEEKAIDSRSLENPFLESKSGATSKNISANPFNTSQQLEDVDLSTHMVYVNNKTGQKRVVKLLKSQMKIKPKKLVFDTSDH